MVLGFVYLYKICYVLFYFIFQKAENNKFKKNASWSKFCNIILFLLKIGSIGPVDQQINLIALESTWQRLLVRRFNQCIKLFDFKAYYW